MGECLLKLLLGILLVVLNPEAVTTASVNEAKLPAPVPRDVALLDVAYAAVIAVGSEQGARGVGAVGQHHGSLGGMPLISDSRPSIAR